MTTTRRTQLREVMQMAWSWFRQVGGTFGDALRTAWRRQKMAAAPVVRTVFLKSPVLSPTSNKLAGTRYARTRDRQAGRQVACW